MTADLLTRHAERALGGAPSAIVRPDLPPRFASGLLAGAPAEDLTRAMENAAETVEDVAGSPEGFAGNDAIEPRKPESATSPHAADPGAGRATVGPAREEIPYRRPPGEGVRAPTPARHTPGALEPSPGRTSRWEARTPPDSATASGPARDHLTGSDASPAETEPGRAERLGAFDDPGRSPALPLSRLPHGGSGEPDIHVSIGRVEVRLHEAAAAPVKAQRRPRPAPALSLEDYLRRRSERPT
jgi:hypothetical protein